MMLPFVWNVLLAMGATLGFAVLFNAPRRTLLLCALTGGVALLVRDVLLALGASASLSTLVGALAIGLLGELGARRFRTPASVFMVTGFIPLVPGALSYRTVLELLNGNYNEGLISGLRTTLLAGAIAMGIGAVTALFRLRE